MDRMLVQPDDMNAFALSDVTVGVAAYIKQLGERVGDRLKPDRPSHPKILCLHLLWVAYNADKRPADITDKVQRRA